MKLPIPQKTYSFEWLPEWRDDRRLREILAEVLPELSSRAIVKLVSNGLVRADGETLDDLDKPFPEGAVLTVDLRHGIKGEQKPTKPRLADRMQVLDDREDFVVVSKAAGVSVQPTDEKGDGPPLVELLKHYWRAKKQPILNPTVVHRLDKDTSGLMVLAKSIPAARHLQRQAGGRFMERRYIAVVGGKMEPDSGIWQNYIGEGENGLRQVVAPSGAYSEEKTPPLGVQEAITRYKVVERLRGATVIELKLETGRRHQIRIHCAEAGHPVIGDRVYSKLAVMRHPELALPAGKKGPKRLMLHASRLKFQTPEPPHRWLTFRSDPPGDFQEFVENRRLLPRPETAKSVRK